MPRAAQVPDIRKVDLPSPRDQVTTKEDPGYLRARHAVYQALKGAHE